MVIVNKFIFPIVLSALLYILFLYFLQWMAYTIDNIIEIHECKIRKKRIDNLLKEWEKERDLNMAEIERIKARYKKRGEIIE